MRSVGRGTHILELNEAPSQHTGSPGHGKVELQVICNMAPTSLSAAVALVVFAGGHTAFIDPTTSSGKGVCLYSKRSCWNPQKHHHSEHPMSPSAETLRDP